MNKIQVLPEILANKIAAGEIVERPASAVKELVENSLDAGSRAICVSVRSGGKHSILVRDDGEGMGADDALLAFEHHATSKLRSADDLASIATLGFRGEALPSIASVSHLVLRTRRMEDASGTEVDIHGGVMRSVKSIPWDKGTEIEARDLFYNIPARRKFLRANDTELGHVTRLVTHYALAHPETRFTLTSEGRTLMDVTAVPDIRDRVFQIFGDGFLETLIPFDSQDGAARAHGFTSLPEEQRTNAYSQYIFVNGRMVRDKVLIGAIRQAYRGYMPASAYPVTILFLELPFDEVDVNAHPAKTEIRFREQNAVHRLVSEAIDRALKGNIAIPSYTHRQGPSYPVESAGPDGDDFVGGAFGTAESPATSSSMAAVADAAEAQWNLRPARSFAQPALNYPPPSYPEPAPAFAGAAGQAHLPRRAWPSIDTLLGPIQQEFPGARGPQGGFDLSGARILGQMHDSYIIAADARGLLIVDQHVAHERILYEKFAAEAKGGRVETQGLLIPLTLELTPQQMALIQQVLPELERNGFEVEPFGGNSILIRSVPALAGEADSRALLAEILEGLDGDEGGERLDVEKIRDRIVVKSACHAAVKVNMPLSPEKMRWLLDELARTAVPTNCPHGRPIVLRFSLYEIEKNFGRA